MSEAMLDRALDEVARPLRGSSGLARLLIGVAAAILLLAMAAWFGRAGLLGPWWVLAVWGLVAVLLAAGVVLARRAIDRLGPWHVGALLEQQGAWRHGALTTVLDASAPNTSVELHAMAEAREAAEVRQRAPEALHQVIAGEVHLARRAGAVAAMSLVALVAARPTTGLAAGLWDVSGAWMAITAPIALEAQHDTVALGEPAVLHLHASGRRQATLFTRTPGEAWQTIDVPLDGDGRATITTAPLAAALVAHAEAGGHRSDDVHVGFRLGTFLGLFTVMATYPTYLGLESEALPVGGDTLVIPEGTRLDIVGRATATLVSVALDGPARSVTLAVDGGAFRGEVTPHASGEWRLRVVPADGVRLEGQLPVLSLRVVPDSAPTVEIPVPGGDTVATPTMRLPLVVALRDDHGLSAAAIEWRIGNKGTMSRQPLALPPSEGDRALVTTTLDLTALGLQAGDTLHYSATGTDNAPARHFGRSTEFLLRIPTAEEQRAAQAQATAKTGGAIDSLAAAAKRLQRTTEDLAQERTRSSQQSQGDAAKDPLALDAARKGETVAQQQDQLIKDAEKLAQSVEQLRQAAERQGLADSALAARLADVRKLLDQAMSPELKAKLATLQQSLKDLDADRTQSALEDLAKAQAQLKDALEQAKELFKRAALESDLGNMAKEAKALSDKQQELNAKRQVTDSGQSPAQQEQQQQLARRADSLGAALDRSAAKVPAQNTKQGLQQAAEQVRDAASKMRDASKAAKDGNQQQAKQSGEGAQKELEPLDAKIREQREQMQTQMRKEVAAGLERALQETSRLAQRQVQLAQAFERGALVSQSRIEQGLIAEGTGKVLQQVSDLAGKNALVTPQAAAALAGARELMRGAVDAVSTASPDFRQAGEQSGDAVDALSVAAYQLLSAKDKVDGSESGSGMKEAMDQMQKMAGQQGQLAQQGQGMVQQGQSGMEQLMQMAMQQRALAQQLDRMRAGGMMPGAGEMAREAKELARSIEAGRMTQATADQQQHLFKKMLDAGRTLQGEEDDENKQRQSTTAKDAAAKIPALLDPRIRNGQGEMRLPSWESLQRLSPEDRRRVIDYFRRLTDGGGPR